MIGIVLPIIFTLLCLALIAAVVAVTAQGVKMLWKEAGDCVNRPTTPILHRRSGDTRADAIDALKQLGLGGNEVADYVDRAMKLCPDCSLQSVVNLVIHMRNADNAE